MYACIPYYTKIKSKHKFKTRNIKLSKTPLPTVCIMIAYMYIHVDGSECKTLIGAVDYAWLFTYAVFLVAR